MFGGLHGCGGTCACSARPLRTHGRLDLLDGARHAGDLALGRRGSELGHLRQRDGGQRSLELNELSLEGADLGPHELLYLRKRMDAALRELGGRTTREAQQHKRGQLF